MHHHDIGDVGHHTAVILIGTVDAIGPHVGAVTLEGRRSAVLEETHQLRGPVTLPAPAEEVAVPPATLRAYAMSVSRLVEDGTRALVRGIGAHAHPAPITAVGRGSTRAVMHLEGKPRGRSPVVVVFDSLLGSRGNAVVGCCISPVVVGPLDVALGQGDDLDLLAITHGIILGHSVGTHIIYGGGRQVLHHVDGTIVLIGQGGAVVQDGGHVLRAPAETLLEDVRPLHRGTSQCAGGTRSHVGVGGHGGSCALRSGDAVTEERLLEVKDSLSHTLGSLLLKQSLYLLNGSIKDLLFWRVEVLVGSLGLIDNLLHLRMQEGVGLLSGFLQGELEIIHGDIVARAGLGEKSELQFAVADGRLDAVRGSGADLRLVIVGKDEGTLLLGRGFLLDVLSHGLQRVGTHRQVGERLADIHVGNLVTRGDPFLTIHVTHLEGERVIALGLHAIIVPSIEVFLKTGIGDTLSDIGLSKGQGTAEEGGGCQ